MLEIVYTSKFKKDVKKIQKRGKDMKKIKVLINKLAKQELLEQRYGDHQLSGNYANHRECHIEPGWLFIYKLPANELRLERTGTHSDLFK